MRTSERNPFVGTWKLNVTNSTFGAGPRPRSLMVRIETSGEAEKGTADGTTAEGQPTHSEYTANYDGREYPVAGSKTADTISLKRINATTTQRVDKKGSKVVETRTRKLSSDGKKFTVTFNATHPNRPPVNHVLVFDRQ